MCLPQPPNDSIIKPLQHRRNKMNYKQTLTEAGFILEHSFADGIYEKTIHSGRFILSVDNDWTHPYFLEFESNRKEFESMGYRKTLEEILHIIDDERWDTNFK